MDTIGKRLTFFIENEGFTKKSFCDKFDFHYDSFVMIMADKRPLGINVLNNIKSALPNLNVDWLLYDGNISNSNMVNEPGEAYNHTDFGEEMIINYLKRKKVQAELKKIYDSFNKM